MLIGKNNLDKLKSKNGVHFLKDISLIGLISDTHIPEAGKSLWPEVIRIFKEVDLILHAGDMHDLSVLKELEEIAPVLACRRNGEDGRSGRPIMISMMKIQFSTYIITSKFFTFPIRAKNAYIPFITF